MLSRVLNLIAAETQEPHGKYYPRPSSAGPERCIRSLVYHARGFDAKPFPGRTLVVFSDGNWHQQLIADWIRKSAFQLHSEEMEIETEVGKGHIDGIITDLLSVDRLLEIKSINHFGYQRLEKGEYPLDYFTQTALYLRGLKKLLPEINEAVLFFKNKNTSAYTDFVLRYDQDSDTLTVVEREDSNGNRADVGQQFPDITAAAVEKFKQVEQHRAAETLPDRPFHDPAEFPCSYCRWGETCWAEWVNEHAELATDVDLPSELADLVRYERETGANAAEMKKEQDGLREIIKDKLRHIGVRSGRAGDYLVDWIVKSVRKLDPELLDPTTKARASVEVPQEKLIIKKIKEEKPGEAKPKGPRKPRENKSSSIMDRMKVTQQQE